MTKSRTELILLAGVLASSIFVSGVWAQSTAPAGAATPAGAGTPQAAGTPFRNQPVRLRRQVVEYYELVWGVDSLSVKAVESGEAIRFSYRILDPEKAKTLNDKKVEPILIAPDKHIKLVIPSMEKVGQLRQSSTPEAGRSYWMAFANGGRSVRRGDHVNVVIGNFHAENLIVE